MQLFIIKYVQILCTTIPFYFINCDHTSFNATGRDDNEMYQVSSCIINCLNGGSERTIELCYNICLDAPPNEKNIYPAQHRGIATLQLLCRSSKTLVIKFGENSFVNKTTLSSSSSSSSSSSLSTLTTSMSTSTSTTMKTIISNDTEIKIFDNTINNTNISIKNNYTLKKTRKLYILRVEENNSVMGTIYMTDKPIVKIEHLEENKIYNISGTIVNEFYEYHVTAEFTLYHTLKRNYVPEKISRLTYIYDDAKDNNYVTNVHLKWNPPRDMTCSHGIYYGSHNDILFKQIKGGEEIYNVLLTNIKLDTVYNVALIAYNDENKQIHSDATHLDVFIPCLTIYKNDLLKCAPHKPTDVLATFIKLGEFKYDVNVTWNIPIKNPDEYVILSIDRFNEMHSFQIPGNSTSLYFSNIEFSYLNRAIYVTALSPGGNITEEAIIIEKTIENNDHTIKYMIIGSALILGSGIVFSIIVIRQYREFKQKRPDDQLRELQIIGTSERIEVTTLTTTATTDRQNQMLTSSFISNNDEHFNNNNNKHSFFINDEMEIDKDKIKLLGVLGEGAFGLVHRGILLSNQTDVAIKMLKETATLDDIKEFYQEIIVMKFVGSHPNIISILGHSTANVMNMMLLTEFCSEGNLLDYLKKTYLKMNENYARIQSINNGIIPLYSTIRKITNKSSNCTSMDSTEPFNNNIIINKLYENNDYESIDSLGDSSSDEETFENYSYTISNEINNNNGIIKKRYSNNYGELFNDIDNNNTGMNVKPINHKCQCKSYVKIIKSAAELKREDIENENILMGKSQKERLANTEITIQIEDCNCNNAEKMMMDAEPDIDNDSNNNNRNYSKNIKTFNCNGNGIINTINPIYKDKNNKEHVATVDSNDGVNNGNNNNNSINESESDTDLDYHMVDVYTIQNVNNISNDDNESNPISCINNPDHYNYITTKDFQHSNVRETTPMLNTKDLLFIARQIANGMEFLSNKKIIHRDLAARNILVCADKKVKIADFGLSRDIYLQNIYKKRTTGKLPLKWLALESLTHQIYTTQSDVWSYGILLYEIITFGGTPYPTVQPCDILKCLKSGYRMPRPNRCPFELYNLMLSCWNTKPIDRPTFSDILKQLDKMILNPQYTEVIEEGVFPVVDEYERPLEYFI